MVGFCVSSWELPGVQGLQLVALLLLVAFLLLLYFFLYKESFERRVLKGSGNGISFEKANPETLTAIMQHICSRQRKLSQI